MKLTIKIGILLSILFYNQHAYAQCAEPDASIWLDTWASCATRMNPISEYGANHWIQYDFGTTRQLSKTWVWNTNDPDKLDQGFNLVKIDFSIDGENWTNWGTMEFPKAQGEAIYSGFSGPDLSGLEARYVLLTAMTNHGHPSCCGIAEIKFNLLPNMNPQVPEACGGGVGFETVGVKELSTTEAFLFWDYQLNPDLETFFIFQFRQEGQEWTWIETNGLDMFLEDLEPGTYYEFKLVASCGDLPIFSEMGYFITLDRNAGDCVQGIDTDALFVEDITSKQATLGWDADDLEDPFFIFEIKAEGGLWTLVTPTGLETQVENLNPNTNYQFRLITECSDTPIYSNPVSFTTMAEEGTVSTNSTSLNQTNIQIFPNPTHDLLTVWYYNDRTENLKYTLKSAQGQQLLSSQIQVTSGKNEIQIDLSTYPDGIYLIETIDQRQSNRFFEKVIKVSR